MSEHLVYWAYGAAALGACAVYVGLPKDGRPARMGLFTLVMALAAVGLVLLLEELIGPAANRAAFYVLAILGVGSAVRVVTHPKPVYSALYFIMVMLSTAGLIIQVGSEFLAAALVIVYGGAIIVTYVFVIMLAQQSTADQPRGGLAEVLDYDRSAREPAAAVLAGFVLMAALARMIVQRDWGSFEALAAAEATSENTLKLGTLLMTEFAISVELAAVLLMVAMIGAIALARKKIPRADDGVEVPPPGEIGRRAKPF